MKKFISSVSTLFIFSSAAASVATADSANLKASSNCENGAAFYAVKELMTTEYVDGRQIAANKNLVTRAYVAHSVIPGASTVKNVEMYYVIVHSRLLDQKSGSSQVDRGEIYTVEMQDNGGALCPLLKIEVTKL